MSAELPTGELTGKLWQRLRPYRRRLGGSLGLLVFAVPLINFHPLVWGIVADKLIARSLTPADLLLWLGIMFGTYIVGIAANAWHSYLLEKTGQAFVRDIRSDLFRKFEAQSLAYHRDNSTGELVTRITSDVDAMEQSVLQGLTGLVEEVVTFIVVAGMVLWISPVVGSLSILPLAFAFLFIRIYNRKVKTIYAGVRKRLGNIGSFVQDRLAGIQVTQSFVREPHEQATFDDRSDQYYQASVRASRLRNTYFPVVSLFGFINNLVMLGVGGWLIMSGSQAFTVGALLAFRGFWWRLQSPIRTIAQTSDILQKARAAAQRIMELLEAPVCVADSPNAISLEAVRGSIEFRHVNFRYPDGETVLEDISFKIAPGEFVAIAGSSGSGKSTLLNLVPRFYDVTAGTVLIDGVAVRDLSLSSLRGTIGLVGQENYLFDGTVEANLTYGVPDADTETIRAAAEAANAHRFISELPAHYQTRVGQNGVKLSGGQRQRLSLARALLKQPKILLLDEPTASVEPESESLIHQAIRQRARSGSGTTILATHHVDLLRKAPRILFFSAGRLAGDATHETLLATCPDYLEAYHGWELSENLLA
jgi:ABC-type multidrug transport system fused ATPase/permease subunit